MSTEQDAEDREFDARTALYSRGIELQDFRSFPLEMLEALAEVASRYPEEGRRQSRRVPVDKLRGVQIGNGNVQSNTFG